MTAGTPAVGNHIIGAQTGNAQTGNAQTTDAPIAGKPTMGKLTTGTPTTRTLTIGEASRQSGVSAKMIRHYEAIGLIPAVGRGSSGYRLYRADDVHNLRFIGRARSLGFPIATIAELLTLWRDGGRCNADVRRVAQSHTAALRAKMAALADMAAALDHLVGACSGDGRPECPILDDLAGPPPNITQRRER